MDSSSTKPLLNALGEGLATKSPTKVSNEGRAEDNGSSYLDISPSQVPRTFVSRRVKTKESTQSDHYRRKRLPSPTKTLHDVSVALVDDTSTEQTGWVGATAGSLTLSEDSVEKTPIVSIVKKAVRPNVTRSRQPMAVDERFRPATPLSNEEPASVAKLRAQIIEYVTMNPLKIVETFKDIGLTKPEVFHIDNVWLSMFKVVYVVKRKQKVRLYQCYACGLRKAYDRQNRAQDHWKTHAKHKPVPCGLKCGDGQCKERFISNEAMSAHVYRANVARKDCSFCGKDFEGRNVKKHLNRCLEKLAELEVIDRQNKRRKIVEEPSKNITAENNEADIDTLSL